MKGFCAALLATLMLVGIAGQAVAQVPAVEIFYDLQNLGGARWQYTYEVRNNDLGKYIYYIDPTHPEWGQFEAEGVEMFEIYFPARQDNPQWPDLNTSDAGLFSNVVETGVPANWDVRVAKLGPTTHPPITAPVWTLNAYAIDASKPPVIYPLLKGESASGFSVAFDYSGTGTPGDQQFSVLGSATLDPIFDGRTEPKHVPEPAGLLLLGAGMFGVALRKRSGS